MSVLDLMSVLDDLMPVLDDLMSFGMPQSGHKLCIVITTFLVHFLIKFGHSIDNWRWKFFSLLGLSNDINRREIFSSTTVGTHDSTAHPYSAPECKIESISAISLPFSTFSGGVNSYRPRDGSWQRLRDTHQLLVHFPKPAVLCEKKLCCFENPVLQRSKYRR